jgi:hypothetical protein
MNSEHDLVHSLNTPAGNDAVSVAGSSIESEFELVEPASQIGGCNLLEDFCARVNTNKTLSDLVTDLKQQLLVSKQQADNQFENAVRLVNENSRQMIEMDSLKQQLLVNSQESNIRSQLLQKELAAANKTIEGLEIQLVSAETKAFLREKELLDDIEVYKADAEHSCDLARKEIEKSQVQAEVAQSLTNIAKEHIQVLAHELVQIRGILQEQSDSRQPGHATVSVPGHSLLSKNDMASLK